LVRKTVNNAILQSEEYQGYLSKRGPHLIPIWRKRFFVLKRRRLYYYQSEENNKKAKGIINFDLVCCHLTRTGENYFNLEMKGVSRVF